MKSILGLIKNSCGSSLLAVTLAVVGVSLGSHPVLGQPLMFDRGLDIVDGFLRAVYREDKTAYWQFSDKSQGFDRNGRPYSIFHIKIEFSRREVIKRDLSNSGNAAIRKALIRELRDLDHSTMSPYDPLPPTYRLAFVFFPEAPKEKWQLVFGDPKNPSFQSRLVNLEEVLAILVRIFYFRPVPAREFLKERFQLPDWYIEKLMTTDASAYGLRW